jgi:flap endonuclease-1
MGSNIAPLVAPLQVAAKLPKGEVVAIDGHNAVVQAMSKSVHGQSMGAWRDCEGNPIAHLYGIMNRAVGILKAGAWPIFVFDGKPADAKGKKDFDRIKAYASAQRNIAKAQAEGDAEYVTWLKDRPAYFWPKIFRDVKQLLAVLGCPYLQAAGEGEAQAAFLCMAGVASAVISQDYDTLLFGAPRLYRRAQGAKATYGEIRLADVLRYWGISREQLVDVAILAGTDFHPGIKSIGPKLALNLVTRHGSIEGIPHEIRARYNFPALSPTDVDGVRGLFLAPDVCADVPTPLWRAPSRDALIQLCCREHHLNENRVLQAAERWASALKRAPKVLQARLF